VSVLDQIAGQIESLSPQDKKALLLRLTEGQSANSKGPSGTELLANLGTLDEVSAREMIEAIESGCESVDASEW